MTAARERGKTAGSPPTPRGPDALRPQAAEPSAPAPAHSSRVKTLAPPPPLAAFEQRVATPVARTPEVTRRALGPRAEPGAAVAERAQLPESSWGEPAPDPQLASLRPTKARSPAWGYMIAFGLGALTATGVLSALTTGQRTDPVSSARATVRPSPAAVVPMQLPEDVAVEEDEARAATVQPEAQPDPPPAPATAAPPPAIPEARDEPSAPAARSVRARAAQAPEATAVSKPQSRTAKPSPLQPPASEPDAVTEPAPEPAGEVLPEQPTRNQIKQALDATRPELQTCAAGQHGTAFANITIAGGGRVLHSSIEGEFAGTPQGSCMARALRSARFPRFVADSMTVRFPFVL